jgi:inhibitor of cysteine peptidase
MKRFLGMGMVLMAVGLAFLAGCSSSGGGGGTKIYGTSNTSITASSGEQFIIQLNSNKTTGFQWGISTSLDAKVVKKIKSTYIVSASSGKVGAGGIEQWTFQAVGPGATRIVMAYSRPFEKGAAPAQVVTFNVTVK